MSKAVKALAVGAAIFFTGGLAAAGLALAGVGAGVVGAVYSAGLYLGASVALSGLSLALAGTQKAPRIIQDVEYSGTLEPRRIIYGRMKVSGMNVIPPLISGQNGETLHQVLALAGHPVHDIGSVYFDDVEITDAQIAAVTGTAEDGRVTGGNYANVARIRRYDGTQTTADYILRTERGADWTTAHIGYGIPYIAVAFKLDQEKYARGKPEITAIVEGKKVYDPRLDTSPGANPGNASYITYSSNPALCLADYLVDGDVGLGEDPARIDWTLVVAAANICDENVVIPTGTQDRYTCNVVLTTAARYEDNITTIASAMMGHCYYSGGKWLMYAGAAQAPSFALTSDDIVGDFQVITAMPYQERYNAVRGRYIDAARNWQEVEFNPRINAAYVSEDGEQLFRDTAFPATTDEYEAQRNAIVALRMSRNKTVVTARFAMSAWGIRPFEVGTLTLPAIGWSAQPVTCESWQFLPEGVVQMTLREYDSTVWADPQTNQYGAPNSLGKPILTGFTPFAVPAVSAVGQAGNIFISWTLNAQNPAGIAYAVWRHTAATPFASATFIGETTGTSWFDTRYDTSTYYYWVTARNIGSGLDSTPTPSGEGVPAAATSAAGGGSLAVVTNYGTVSSTLQYVSGGATIPVTATASGGTSPYTYAWTKISGDTITIDSPSSATTTFSVTGMSNGTARSAQFRVRATDNVAATADAFVWVYINRNDEGWQ